jgi:hypothetical protein
MTSLILSGIIKICTRWQIISIMSQIIYGCLENRKIQSSKTIEQKKEKRKKKQN